MEEPINVAQIETALIKIGNVDLELLKELLHGGFTPSAAGLGVFKNAMPSTTDLKFSNLNCKVHENSTFLKSNCMAFRMCLIEPLQRTKRSTWKSQHHTVRLLFSDLFQRSFTMRWNEKVPACIKAEWVPNLMATTHSFLGHVLRGSEHFRQKWFEVILWKLCIVRH